LIQKAESGFKNVCYELALRWEILSGITSGLETALLTFRQMLWLPSRTSLQEDDAVRSFVGRVRTKDQNRDLKGVSHAPNHEQFNNPSGNINNGTFGYVTSARDPRIGQVALKLIF
jgi:hypothetical protein